MVTALILLAVLAAATAALIIWFRDSKAAEFVYSGAAVLLLTAADYFIKLDIVRNFTVGQSRPAINGLLNWTYITNNGASWGIFGGKTIFLVAITLALIVVMLYMLFSGRIKNWLCRAAFILVAAGGIGNLIDRVFNGGKVVDYIDVSPLFDFPVFNFADCCVTVGGVLFCIFILFFYDDKKDGKKITTESDENK